MVKKKITLAVLAVSLFDEDGRLFELLLSTVVRSVSFSPSVNGPKTKPFPLQVDLARDFSETSIQQMLFGEIHKRTQDFPFACQMLLFAMTALASSLPPKYKYNYRKAIALAFGGLSESSLRQGFHL
jgi:hypothetical protein